MQDNATLDRREAAARHAGADLLTLPDGRTVRIRPVRPHDAAAEQAFVVGLSPLTRYRRFHLGLSELPAALLRRFTEVDQSIHVALVVESAGAIVADARYVRDSTGRTGEFAIAVADAWQGLGLGSALMQRLLAHARRSGLERLCGGVLADNVAMLAVMRRLGARLAADPEDEALYRVCLAL